MHLGDGLYRIAGKCTRSALTGKFTRRREADAVVTGREDLENEGDLWP
ncbi:hypothetical protein SEA_SLIMJIMMY_108 [Mycobacterium phage SlimJimmy]|uniref:Uncharacterized protein n=1 Tax=Mycobacterium phage PegLeg TaxID=1325953 RepID=R4T909_9CAUD|nr:hypothetical protein PEGLEG_109 [Mycobacterium phage PegLeg]AGM12344.1 hypothetical protein PEGLEG_109 [Mycobacterium phage PegLeg]WMI33275.1 hypothetical protein SEA_SLIMJIMMY_108 [Mycobacterium phage SlimJimmy]